MKNSSNKPFLSNALIFIPDISGFTKFVTDTEINHSRHIIEELLEIIIDANQLNLELSEIEGDAILFYRFGNPPGAAELLDQVKTIFSNFHLHLKKYETHRVCNCGACRTAHELSIKFIVHYGEITMNTIREHKKLFGKEVIMAHRLLKNDIDRHEYCLFTHKVQNADPSWSVESMKLWAPINFDEKDYDCGKIRFSYLDLEPLKDQVPELKASDFGLSGATMQVMETEHIINAPLQTVFSVVCDVAFRPRWIPGIDPVVTEINSKLTQTGQTHKCLANEPTVIGHNYFITNEMVSFSETPAKKTHEVLYTLTAITHVQTRIKAQILIPHNPVKSFFFKIFMKKKMMGIFEKAWQELGFYCGTLTEKEVNHAHTIMLHPEVEVMEA